MSVLTRLKNLFRPSQEDAAHPALSDPRLPKAISGLMKSVQLTGNMVGVSGAGADGPAMQDAKRFKLLHDEFPDCPQLHYVYAAALQVAMQGETAKNVLTKCVEAHPHFWLAKATLTQNALHTWNPFFQPEFTGDPASPVHPVINEIVSGCILLATRRGVLPRAVLFLRDAGDEFQPDQLKSCRMQFMTTISQITSPQVVAINARLHDNPSNPFECEAMYCPLRPFGDRERLPYELFARQRTFEFAVLDRSGRPKHVRQVTVSSRQKGVHAELARMLARSEGPALPIAEIVSALKRHQMTLDPKDIVY